VRAVTLERDPYDSWIGDGILLADCRSETRVKALAEGSELTHVIDLRVQVQVPTLLALAPRKVVQDLADALMRRKTESFTDDMLGCLKRALA